MQSYASLQDELDDAMAVCMLVRFFFSSRRRHTRFDCDWSSDVCSSDLEVRYDGVGVSGSALLDLLPGLRLAAFARSDNRLRARLGDVVTTQTDLPNTVGRSEERRVGKECRSRWSPYH